MPCDPVSSTLFAGRPHELPRVGIDRALLLVDGDQVVKADRVRMQHRLQVPAARALAPAKRGGMPVGRRGRWRQQAFDVLENAFEAGRNVAGSLAEGTSATGKSALTPTVSCEKSQVQTVAAAAPRPSATRT